MVARPKKKKGRQKKEERREDQREDQREGERERERVRKRRRAPERGREGENRGRPKTRHDEFLFLQKRVWGRVFSEQRIKHSSLFVVDVRVRACVRACTEGR
jgi:hypothetical protein